jgi:stage II sporulation protein AB (anti-sigma F factor)
MTVSFDAISINEGFARMTVAAFMVGMDPTVEELTDVKTAVSEAVTNAVIHGYDQVCGKVVMTCEMEEENLTIYIQDQGQGISDVAKAREPFYTSRPELERSGMGFSFMEAFMDELNVYSHPGIGTTVVMKKRLQGKESYAAV